MDFREWGAEESGVRVAEFDDQKRQLFELALQKAPLERNLLAQHAAAYEADAAKKRAEVGTAEARQKAILEWQARRGVEPQSENPLEALTGDLVSMAQLELGMGNPEGARKIAGTLSQIQSRGALEALRQVQTDAANFKLLRDVNNAAANFARNATDQRSWEAAGELFARMTGMDASEIFGQPFSPELRDRVVQSSLTAAQAATAEFQRRTAATRERAVGISAANLELNRRIRERQLELAEQREKRLEKVAGGKSSSTTPTREERETTSRLIRQQFPDIAEDDRAVAAVTVASEAKRLMRKNPALSWDEARTQAFASQMEFFQTEDPTFGKRKTTFRAVGRSPSRALPFPQSPRDAKVGSYYRRGDQIFRFLGGQEFEPIDDDEEDDD